MSWKQWLKHTFEALSNEPRFSLTCGIGGCSATFRTFSAFSSHLNRKHPTISIVSPDQNHSTCYIMIPEQESLSNQNDLPAPSNIQFDNVNDDHMLDTGELRLSTCNECVTLAGGSK